MNNVVDERYDIDEKSKCTHELRRLQREEQDRGDA